MRVRLRTKCFLAGRIHQPGDIVVLPDGVKGPHRTVSAYQNADEIVRTNSPINADRMISKHEDRPLFDMLPDEPVVHSAVQKEQADLAARQREENLKKGTTR